VEHDHETPPPVVWWASQRVRLGVLLLCLAAAIVLLLGTRTSLLDAVGFGGSGAAEGRDGSAMSAPMRCVANRLPALADANLYELVKLRGGPLAVFEHSGGRRYAAGIATPEDMWSDDLPLRVRPSRLADGLWPAAYEIRWWTRDYNVVADALMLAEPREARELFEDAASTYCHRAAVVWPVLSPPRARNLTWVNPDGARQADVFLLRGRRVYRVAAVRLQDAPAESPQAERRVAARLVDTLACSLPGAGCMASGGDAHSP
jgi:hypothetical protein